MKNNSVVFMLNTMTNVRHLGSSQPMHRNCIEIMLTIVLHKLERATVYSLLHQILKDNKLTTITSCEQNL